MKTRAQAIGFSLGVSFRRGIMSVGVIVGLNVGGSPAHSAEPTRAASSARASGSDRAQFRERANAFAFELLGRGGIYSLNYDRELTDRVAAGIGFSYFQNTSYSGAKIRLTAIPVYANFYIFNEKHRPFLTAGATYFSETEDFGRSDATAADSYFIRRKLTRTSPQVSAISPNVGIGYEFRATHGFLFRASVLQFVGESSFTTIGIGAGFTI